MTTDSPSPAALTELLARVQALEAWRAHQTDLLDELINNDRIHRAGRAFDDDPDEEIDDEDDDGDDVDRDQLIDWVHRCVTPVIARPLRGEHVWCPRWWDHPEAVFRFEALRRAWTELAPEPGVALSIWIRDHLDPCLHQLLSPAGPFADCTHNPRARAVIQHTPVATLPMTTPVDEA